MNEPDFIDKFFPFLRGKTFWLSIFLVVCLLMALLIRGLIPTRLSGGSAYGFSGAYGDATSETGFDLEAVGLRPSDRYPNSGFAKIVGKRFTDQISGEDYIVFAMKNDAPQKDVILLLHVERFRNILTSERDKNYGGDTVLTPIAFLSWSDFQKLASKQLFIGDIKPSGFSKKCKIRANNRSWMGLAFDWYTTSACYSKDSSAGIYGFFRASTGSIRIGVRVRDEDGEFWFGDDGYEEKRYSDLNFGIKFELPKDQANRRLEEAEKPQE